MHLPLHEFGHLTLKLLVDVGVAGKHAGTHGVSQAILDCRFAISFTHFRVVAEAQVVVERPIEDFLSTESHPRSDFAFQFWKGEISVANSGKLPKVGLHHLINLTENVQVSKRLG